MAYENTKNIVRHSEEFDEIGIKYEHDNDEESANEDNNKDARYSDTAWDTEDFWRALLPEK